MDIPGLAGLHTQGNRDDDIRGEYPPTNSDSKYMNTNFEII